MLNGCRVLVVEDDPLVMETLCAIITDAEGIVVGSAATVAEARASLNSGQVIDVGLLDVNIAGCQITPVLEGLAARGIPLVVYTGAEVPDGVRQRHPGLVSLRKPVARARLVAELKRVRAQGSL